MRDGRFRHLPVVRDGHLLGIISDRDVERPDCRTVAVVMHADVIAVNPDTPIEVAARLMLDNKIGALPVVEQGTDSLVGIVSQTDLFSVLARLLSGDGPNTRLELHLIDLPRQLATVSALADQRHIHIISLVTLPADAASPDRRTVVLRIGTMIVRPFVQALRQANIDVDLPEQPDA